MITETASKEQIRDIQAHARSEGLTMGDALQFLAHDYGWLWGDIPTHRVDDVKRSITFWARNRDDVRAKVDAYIAKVQNRKTDKIGEPVESENVPF